MRTASASSAPITWGGCYGTTGPASPSPADGLPYGSRFPHVEAADQARLQALLLDSLGIERIHLAGPSVGGLIALSFACQFPERARSFISIGSGYRASIEHRLSLFEQILAIELDPDFRGGDYYQGPAPKKGLAFARIIGHKSFVYQEGLEQRARKEVGGKSGLLTWMTPTRSTQSYMLHQGTKFAERFDANAYIRIADMWAEFDIRDHAPDGTFKTALEGFRRAGIPSLVFSIDTDCCFRPAEQQDFVAQLESARIPVEFHTIVSTKGHDSFLLEPELYAEPIRRILAEGHPEHTP
ncbi:alpha/beta fold hydrolase [Akkermansia massiliensis]|nr:alpha/beta fold hydrolase [Akkermansia massiliensis]